MNVERQEVPIERQSVGSDPKAAKRNSGLFSFLRWFKNSSTSRESVNSDSVNSTSGSCDSINSTYSTGTVASFSYVPPNAYKNHIAEKCIAPGPETDTYRARLKQRDKVRERDKNVTLRKKYNLFFNRDTLLKPDSPIDDDNSKSLPLMTKKTMEKEEERMHRRTASESSKIRKAGAYCHVKGKRRAPQPPANKNEDDATASLRRKKRLAPPPPQTAEKIISTIERLKKIDAMEYADAEVIFNDSLKLDHGILKPAKEADTATASNLAVSSANSPTASARSSYAETPVSPRPWYKRNTNRDSGANFKKDKESRYEPIEKPAERQSIRNLTDDVNLEETKIDRKKDEKRKSGLSFLTNISELDREASEIIKKDQKTEVIAEMPAFMRPKQEPDQPINVDSLLTPKRRSAKDLIAKFNAITNVTKVTVNSAFFQKEKRDYFGKSANKNDAKKETKLAARKDNKKIDVNENNLNPLMKSESAASVSKSKSETPKSERKSWHCPKCSLENDYWRIICHVCSTIKPYFDDLSTPSAKINNSLEKKIELKKIPTKIVENNALERNLERSRTQIGFSALAKYNENKKMDKTVEEKPKAEPGNKKEEREKLIKMLIEMKNSLPKRKPNGNRKSGRNSVIEEAPEEDPKREAKPQTVAEVVVATTETVYENIKMKRAANPKPLKVSSSAQTSAVVRKAMTPAVAGAIKKEGRARFEPMKPKDFADIYNDKTGKPSANVYANLAANDDLSLLVNMPKRFAELRHDFDLKNMPNNTDTLEINRLLRRLETAIAKGELTDAAIFARELAQLKVNCSVIRQKVDGKDGGDKKEPEFTVDMFVEDKLSHRGPFPIQVVANQTVAELKAQVQKEFEIPTRVQRWILGKELAMDDKMTLTDHHVTSGGCPVFLYLVAPNKEAPKVNQKKEEKPTVKSDDKAKVVDYKMKERVKTPSNIEKIEIEVKETKIAKKTEAKAVPKEQPSTSQTAAKMPPLNTETITINVLPKQEPCCDEDFEYDSKTLRPQLKDWECKMCTLLNPTGSNICAVCATIRHKDDADDALKGAKKKPQTQRVDSNDHHYLQLVDLDNADLVENSERFECVVCMMDIDPGHGVTLRECLHQFCKTCLAHTVEFTDEAEIKCPFRDDQYSCDIALQDREIKALVSPAIYEQYLARSVAQVENKTEKSFHCKTPDCKGWCIFEDNVNEFRCPVCRKMNCLTCQAIHIGMNCKQYQEKMNAESETDEDAKRTREMLDAMVSKGEALTCPACQVILMKKWGCDWVRCSMCKTEICWVTRGPRWGPAGKGDTSGGCKCGVNGIKCHAQCNYCH